jgi:hypothetical protein
MERDVYDKPKHLLKDLFGDHLISTGELACLKRALQEGMKSMITQDGAWVPGAYHTTLDAMDIYAAWLRRITPIIEKEVGELLKKAEAEELLNTNDEGPVN